MSKNKRNKVPKITEEEYSKYLATLRETERKPDKENRT